MLYPNTGLLVAADTRLAEPDNLEEYAQKRGQVVHLPTLRDHLTYHIGELFIKVGEKMTTASLRHMHLDGKLA